MYHTEFSKNPAKPVLRADVAMPYLPLELGGGLSLGLAASLNQPVSMLVFFLGGVLPLVTCCISIAAHRCNELMNSLMPTLEAKRLQAVPVPHFFAASSAANSRNRRRETMRSGH